MHKYHCLNPIAAVGLDLFSDDYQKVEDIKDAEAVLVRSAAMHGDGGGKKRKNEKTALICKKIGAVFCIG